MTRNQIVIEYLVELINERGRIDRFTQAMSQLVNRAKAIERADALGSEPSQKTDPKCGYANDFKPEARKTRSPSRVGASNTCGFPGFVHDAEGLLGKARLHAEPFTSAF